MDNLITVLLVFVGFVVPFWILMHYRSRRKAAHELSARERELLEELMAQSERMAQRIDTLESILDAETPDWRRRTADRYKEVGS